MPKPTRETALRSLRASLASGAYQPGQVVESSRKLGTRLGLNHNTVARALDQLVAEGDLERAGRMIVVAKPQRRETVAAKPRRIHLVLQGGAHSERFCAAFAQLGIQPLLRPIQNPTEAICELEHALAVHADGALLVWPRDHFEDGVLRSLRARGLPFVVSLAQHPELDSVCGNYATIAIRLAEIIRRRGYEEVVLALPRERFRVLPKHRGLIPDVHEWLHFALTRQGIRPEQIRTMTPPAAGDEPGFASRLVREAHPGQLLCTSERVSDFVYEGLRGSLGRQKPGLLAIGRPPYHQDAVAWIDGNLDEEARLAASRLLELCRHRDQHHVLPAPISLEVSPIISLGRTLTRSWQEPRRKPGSPPTAAPSQETTTPPPLGVGTHWPVDRARRIKALGALHREPFTPRPTGRLKPLPLRANAITTGVGGWFGRDVLLNLGPGDHPWHGITFHLMPDRPGGAAVGFVRLDAPGYPSLARGFPNRWHGKRLPSGMRAIYFLHALGYCQDRKHFADLVATHRSGTTSTTPWHSASEDIFAPQPTPQLMDPEACATDWWPNQPLLRNAHTLPVVVAGPDQDPLTYERHLYVHRWAPPAGFGPLESLEIRLRPKTEVRYGLLAVTVELES